MCCVPCAVCVCSCCGRHAPTSKSVSSRNDALVDNMKLPYERIGPFFRFGRLSNVFYTIYDIVTSRARATLHPEIGQRRHELDRTLRGAVQCSVLWEWGSGVSTWKYCKLYICIHYEPTNRWFTRRRSIKTRTTHTRTRVRVQTMKVPINQCRCFAAVAAAPLQNIAPEPGEPGANVYSR